MINVYEIDESVSVYGNSKLQVLYTVAFKMIKNIDTQVYEVQLDLNLNCEENQPRIGTIIERMDTYYKKGNSEHRFGMFTREEIKTYNPL